jgi:hypothetical protein
VAAAIDVSGSFREVRLPQACAAVTAGATSTQVAPITYIFLIM